MHQGSPAATVVLVGAGPGSVSLVERLAANHHGRALDVHLVDPYPPAGGRVWRAGQSELMRMNSMAGDVTMFTDDTVTMDGPVRGGPTLAQWVQDVTADELDNPSLLPQVRAVTPTTFPDRRVQGEYLQWVLRRAVTSAGSALRVHVHTATVTDVVAGGPQTVVLDNGQELAADVVVLSLGHVDVTPSGDVALAAQAAEQGLRYLPPAYTADVDWADVPAGEPVLVRGLGLAFVDLVVLLTEGRGGRFVPGDAGTVVYRPSGREPRLFAGSRRGLVHHSKTGYPLQGPRPPMPAVFTADVVTRLTERGPVDFRADVWPWVAAEIRYDHYHELFHAHPLRVRVPWADVEPVLRWTGADVDAVLATVVPDLADRLDLGALDAPLAGREFPDVAALHAHVVRSIEADVARRSDPDCSADLGAFLGVLVSYGQVNRLVQAGAIDPASQLVDVDGWWRGLFNHLASGPPPDRLEQILALARAGVLTFLGAGTSVHIEGNRFVARSASVPGTPVTASTLIDARLPKPHLFRGPGRLLETLLSRGEVSGEVLVDRDGTEHRTGLLRVDAAGRVVDEQGQAHPRRFAMGPLTTARAAAAFARPNTDAPTFRLADAVARAVLAALPLLPPDPPTSPVDPPTFPGDQGAVVAVEPPGAAIAP